MKKIMLFTTLMGFMILASGAFAITCNLKSNLGSFSSGQTAYVTDSYSFTSSYNCVYRTMEWRYYRNNAWNVLCTFWSEPWSTTCGVNGKTVAMGFNNFAVSIPQCSDTTINEYKAMLWTIWGTNNNGATDDPIYCEFDEIYYAAPFTYGISINPTTATVNAGSPASTTVTVSSSGAPVQTITLSASGVPSGWTYNFNGGSTYSCGSASCSVPFSVTTSSSASGTYAINIKGADTSGDVATQVFYVTVTPGFGFSITTNPASGSVTAGSSTTTTVTMTLTSGSTKSVDLKCNGLPSGASCSFSPVTCSPTCTSALTISTSSSTPTGTYGVTIQGTVSDGSFALGTGYALTVNSAAVPTGTLTLTFLGLFSILGTSIFLTVAKFVFHVAWLGG
jgi:hypothetical protein